MVRLLTAALIAALLVASPAPAAAESKIAPPAAPKGWTPIDGLRLGNWLPCLPLYEPTDCIESIHVRIKEGDDWTEMPWRPNPQFDVRLARQTWFRVTGSNGEPLDNSVMWTDQDLAFSETYIGSPEPGHYLLPEGSTGSSGSPEIAIRVHQMSGVFQVIVGVRNSLPTDADVRVTLRSENLAQHVRWISSSTKDPRLLVQAQGVVVIEATTAISPWVGQGTCESGNSSRPTFMANNVVVNLFLTPKLDPGERAGEVFVGTNGWWCFGGIEFDRAAGQLVVKVGTTHYDDDGRVIDGWFEAKIAGRIARAWWGVDPRQAAGYAKVEVSYPDGTTRIATTTAVYVAERDWIDLRSYGFTYSTPALRITMAPPPIEKPAVKGPKVVKKQKLKKVTCVKGKTRKTFTATTCPTGWRRLP
jgi:hypothetical protein